MMVVNGNPAIAYFNKTNSKLMYVRASDANGSQWGSPIDLGDAERCYNGQNSISMAIVNGTPAISYCGKGSNDLMYVRASDANGSAWNASVKIHDGSVYSTTSLVVVNGNPAIAFDLGQTVFYIRADNANGSSWGSRVTIDNGRGRGPSLAVVDGNPAIAFEKIIDNQLRYVRATDADGGSWGIQVIVDTGGVEKPSIAVVNGNPAIAYLDRGNYDLKYVRASSTDGSTWGSPRRLDSSGYVGLYPSLAMVGGVPTISYGRANSGNDSAKFIQATDANGGSWNSPITIESGGSNTGLSNSLAEVNGVLAVSYFKGSSNDLKYARYTGNVNISVWDGSSEVGRNSTLDFGSTDEGTPVTKTLTIRNDGTLPLELKTISLPSRFSVVGSFNESPIGSGSTTTVDVRMDAYTPGSTSGSFSITSTDTNESPYSFTVRGVVMGDTTTTITANTPNPSAPGDTVTVSWTVTASSGTPTGTVTITTDQSTATCNASVATGSCDITLNTVGTHTLTADYGGSSSFNTSSDPTTHELVNAPVAVFGTNTFPSQNAILAAGITHLTIEFDMDVKGSANLQSANSIINYLLFSDGGDGTFDTLDCASGVHANDVNVPVFTASYDDHDEAGPYVVTLVINNDVPLPAGDYRLLACGTTSIQNLAGTELNDGADTSLNFTVQSSSSGGGSGSGDGVSLPKTGYSPGIALTLPPQPATAQYANTAITLSIPKLNLTMPIVGVPEIPNGWDVTWLGNSAGYLAGSAYPTWSGNTVLTGHVWDAFNNPGPFAQLKTLKYGDRVQLLVGGQTYTYEVRDTRIISPNNVDAALQHEEYDWITLVTCEDYNTIWGSYDYRRMVRAVLVKVE